MNILVRPTMLKALLLSSTFTASLHAQEPSGQSLYPADIVAPVVKVANQTLSEPAPLTVEVSATAPVNKKLSRALGPAAFVIEGSADAAAFESQIRDAIGRQPVLHAQVSALDETRAQRRQARAALFPQISAQLRGDYVLTREFAAATDNVVESLRPDEQFTGGVSLSQLVFDGGATANRIKAASARHREFENALTTRINDLALAVLSSYHDVLTHQALAALARGFIARHEEILQNVKDRETLGAGSSADVTQAFARLAAARARLAEIEESRKLSEIRYQEFFADPPTRLRRPLLDGAVAVNRDQIIASAVAANPELAAASARADASSAEYRASKGARLPELRVSVDAVKYDLFDSGDDFDVRAGVNLNYDLFSGGARGANIAQAGSRAKQDRYNEDQIRNEIERDAAITHERVIGGQARLTALEAALIANNETRGLVLERYKHARGDLIDVLQAENDYFEAAVAYLTGLANLDLAIYSKMEHTGELQRRYSPRDEGLQSANRSAHD